MQLITVTLMSKESEYGRRRQLSFNDRYRIMRICFVISLYAGFSWLSIVFPNSYVYLTPWQEYFQGIALGSFFLLLCQFVSPDDRQRENYFAPLQIKQKKGGKLPMDGLTWYRVCPHILL